MTWRYDQSSGQLSRNGSWVANGYSGLDLGKNNPAMEAAKGVGPIPRGKWIIGEPRKSSNVGPYAMPLTPAPGTDTHGRSAFFIHGDSISDPGRASHGCIILIRVVRQRIWESGDHELEVVE